MNTEQWLPCGHTELPLPQEYSHQLPVEFDEQVTISEPVGVGQSDTLLQDGVQPGPCVPLQPTKTSSHLQVAGLQ
jgi:hypothetical protein